MMAKLRQKNTLFKLKTVLCIGLLVLTLPATSQSPHIVTSILPLNHLVAAVTQGVTTPVTLVTLGASAHHYALRPSDLSALEQADIIFWIGPAMEQFLSRSLSNITPQSKIITLIETPDLQLLPLRTSAYWQAEDPAPPQTHLDPISPMVDPHIWLSPDNAIQLVLAVAAILSERDPAHKTIYQLNATQAVERITALKTQLEQQLKPIADRPYLVFHDGYQYFEKAFQLNAIGTITLDPEQSPSARHIQALQTQIGEAQIVCVFNEPQFRSPLVDVVIEKTDVKVSTLDPLGALGETAHLEGYIQLMENLANSLIDCLS